MKSFIVLCAVVTTTAGDSSLAGGKTFIDYFLPTPIRGSLSKDVWGAPEVGPRDPTNGLEDAAMKQWCYRDGQIIKAPDGKYHMFASRWDQAGGHKAWGNSLAVHAVNGQPVDSPSPHTQVAMEADAKAFAAVMGHLKKADPEHTVLMVQVENEPGSWGSVRDDSPAAQGLFEGPVPAELLKPMVLKALNRPTDAKGTWQEVFGNDADEYFHAWSVAHYIGHVAAAGKAWQYLKVEEGRYEDGAFRLLCIRNGDETDWGGPRFGPVPAVLHITLITWRRARLI